MSSCIKFNSYLYGENWILLSTDVATHIEVIKLLYENHNNQIDQITWNVTLYKNSF